MRFTGLQLLVLMASLAVLAGLTGWFSIPSAVKVAARAPEEELNWERVPLPGVLPDGSTAPLSAPTAVPGVSAAEFEKVMELTKMDVNLASEEELVALPGVGPATARSIVAYRDAHGPFTTLDDLVRVKRIGPKTVEKFRDKARVGTEVAPPSELSTPGDAGGGTRAPPGRGGSRGSGSSSGDRGSSPDPAARASWTLDVNTASAEELTRLPGIGPSLSSRIVEYRDASGPFVRSSDLIDVRGIGPKLLEKIRPHLELED